jgi:uncharacterized protein with LGFP repeats
MIQRLGLLSLPLLLALVFGLVFARPAAAATYPYGGADLVDPTIFLDSNAMSANAIQSLLVSKGGALASYTTLFDCASTGTTSNSMYVSAGAPCGQTVPASTIIYYASQIYGINPQVVLATMQKEESLVTDPSPISSQYQQAMGYACPDNGGCGASNFLYQIDNGTWTLRFNYERLNSNSTWWSSGIAANCTYVTRFYTPSLYPSQNVTFIDGNGVSYATYYLANPSTSSLYCYTPHAYNNPQGLYGLPAYGTTGEYYGGSYEFVQAFDSWFGSSTVLPELEARYNQLQSSGASMGLPTDDGFCTDAAHDACWQGFQNGFIVYSKATGAWESYGSIRYRWAQLGYQNGEMGFPDGPVNCTLIKSGCYQQYQNGYIVGSPTTGAWESMGAIRGKWTLLGFEGGTMGFPTGGIYETGSGYYQQYEHGYIVGSATAGWWESMYGPVRNEWGAVGYQNGRLGFPTSDPDCSTQPSSGCVQSFQGGVIYWTQGTGAWQVWGAIAGRYYQMGANGGSLGYPTSAESCTLSNGGCFQAFQNGYIVGDSATGWWESTDGPVRNEWATLGYQDGRLGYPTSNPDCSTQPSSGCVQSFQGGVVLWSQATGAWQVWGAIAGRYYQMGANGGSLGYPTSDEYCNLKNSGCYQVFQNGYIVGSPATGWWESTGGIRTRWGQLGYENGEMGYPTGAQSCTLINSGCFQAYQNGYIVGTSSTGYWESLGTIRNKWASLGYEGGTAGYPTGAVTCTAGTCSQSYQDGTIYSNPSTAWYTPN